VAGVGVGVEHGGPAVGGTIAGPLSVGSEGFEPAMFELHCGGIVAVGDETHLDLGRP
jgi:hypothetical protein